MTQPHTNTTHQGVITRDDLLREYGKQYGGDRDTYDILGYDTEVSAAQYRARYRRQDIAKRIVELPATDTWRRAPTVYDDEADEETAFAEAVEELDRTHRLFHHLKRADIAAGIGEYGLLFIGYADGQPLSEPVNAGALAAGPDAIAYFSVFSQDVVEDWELGRETGDFEATDAMYNQPVSYEIDFADVGGDANAEDVKVVHHSRIVHIVENPVESELKGDPRLRAVWNRLIDLEKVLGASAEMFWTGADRKFQFNIDSDDAQNLSSQALADLDDEVQKLVHDLQHYVKTFNTDMEVFGGEDPDPTGVVEQLLKFISGATGIPVRMLVGSERGELASSQDQSTWYGAVESRMSGFAEPAIARPVFDDFIDFGILPAPRDDRYEFDWPNLFELTDLETSEVRMNRASTLQTVAPANDTSEIAPMEFLMEYVDEGTPIDFEAAAEAEEEAREEAEAEMADAMDLVDQPPNGQPDDQADPETDSGELPEQPPGQQPGQGVS